MNRGHQLDEIDRLREENERLREKLVSEKNIRKEWQDRYLKLYDEAKWAADEVEGLRKELREVRVLISDYWEPEVERLRGLNEYLETRLQDRMVALEDLGVEVERLRKEHEYMTVKTAQYDDMVTEVERLREEIVEARESRDQHFAGRQHNAREVKRLRNEIEVEVATLRRLHAENERLRTEITGLREDDEAKQVKVESLRAALRDMLNVSPQSYDWYQGAARAALNEGKALVEERSRVIDERDAYDGSGA